MSKKAQDLEDELNQQLRFQELFSQLSAGFINLPADEVDNKIEWSLGRIAEYVSIERVALLQFSEGGTKFHLTHTFAGQPSYRAPRWLVSEQLPWFTASLRKGDVLRVNTIDDMPADALPERQYAAGQGLKSFVTVPLSVANSIIGAISYSSMVQERKWTDQEVEHLETVTSLFASVLGRKRAEEALAKRLSFEELIAEISAAFINLPGNEIDGQIGSCMRQVAEALEIDRSLLHEFSEDRSRLKLLQYYIKPGLPEPFSTITSKDQPWLTQAMLNSQVVVLERLADIHPDASLEREYLSKQGVKSGLAVPLVVGELPVGALTFTTIHEERAWPSEVIRQLRIVADVFANALARKQGELNLKNALKEVKQLKSQLEQENLYLREEITLGQHHHEIVGETPALKEILALVEQVAPTEATVLISGETGSGKELVAKAIHDLSPRSKRAMVTVNCSALPATLIESELFGREKGAYTGALTKQMGRFEVADGSTIFLDEISEIPPELQVKLLRVLQDGKFERLGGTRTRRVDVRIIAASNRDMARAIEEGSFREDLFYRLNVFPIAVPPLRDRLEDIPLLVWTFVKQLERSMGKRIATVSPAAMEALKGYTWPGNVRELRNVVEQAMIVATGDELAPRPPGAPMGDGPGDQKLVSMERNHILAVLAQTNWRVKGKGGAAELLGLHPATLFSKMKKLGIKRDH